MIETLTTRVNFYLSPLELFTGFLVGVAVVAMLSVAFILLFEEIDQRQGQYLKGDLRFALLSFMLPGGLIIAIQTLLTMMQTFL